MRTYIAYLIVAQAQTQSKSSRKKSSTVSKHGVPPTPPATSDHTPQADPPHDMTMDSLQDDNHVISSKAATSAHQDEEEEEPVDTHMQRPEKNRDPQENIRPEEEQATDEHEEIDLADIVERAQAGHHVDKILKPDGAGGWDFNVHYRIGLRNDSTWYTDILVSHLNQSVYSVAYMWSSGRFINGQTSILTFAIHILSRTSMP
jgi:NADPH-dependent glutamate synthase beta subunit-like oxidoreductase